MEALVTAASANDDPVALQMIISISRRFKQQTVRERATELVEQIAARRGWSTDELADRTIPTAGFPTADELGTESEGDDADGVAVPAEIGVAILDFGPRHFTMRIAPDLSLALFTADDTPLKALPKPGVKDDADLAKEARSTFTSAKKELAQVVAVQSTRLQEAMALGRTWSAAAWREAFGDHPVMRHLVSRLIWATGPVGEDGEPLAGAAITLLLPTLDGELLDAGDAEFELAPDARLWLSHGSLLDAAEVQIWRERLAAYGVTGLFDQLGSVAPSFAEGATEINEREGWTQAIGALRSRAVTQGFHLGSGQDGGVIESMHKDVGPWRADIDLTGIRPDQQAGEAVSITRLSVWRGRERVPLAEVPPVLLAVVHNDYLVIADGGAFDPEWKARSNR